ncbi:MAG: hypothetical protein V4611_03175 [Patescibacteria group bacterium]
MNPDFQYGPPTQPPAPTPQPGYPQVPQPQQGYPQQQPVYQPTQPPVVNNYVIPPKSSKKWVILTFVFLTTALIALGVGVWAYINYVDQKDNTDAKISTAVTVAVKDQADKDAADFLEKEKQPNRQFAGPDDYGRLSFDYPKTWSIYVDEDAVDGGSYEAYFNPVSVPPVNDATQYALRVIIEEKDYDKVLASYDSLVKKGDLKTSAVKADGTDGTRIDGSFTKDIRGAAVVFKIRDKTVTIRTDADTFIRNKTALDGTSAAAVPGDFDALIATITFNK